MMILELIFIAFLLVALILLIVFAAYQAMPNRIGYIPLPKGQTLKVLDLLDLNSNDTLIDLGCGDARILRMALLRNPSLKTTGIEINPLVVLLARWLGRKIPKPHYKILRGDIYKSDLSGATKVFAYLWPTTMAKLEPKLQQELPKGALLTSVDFALPNRKPDRVVEIGSGRQLGQKVYLYKY